MTVHLQNKTTLAKRDYPNGLSEAYSLHSTAADELTRLQTKHVLGAESSFQACKGRCTNPRDSHEGTVRPFPTAAPSKLPGLAPSLLLARSPPLPPSLPLRWPPLREHSSRISLLYLLTSTHSFLCYTFTSRTRRNGSASNEGSLLRHRPWIPPDTLLAFLVASIALFIQVSDSRILFLCFAIPLLPFLSAVTPASLSLSKISRESRIFAFVVRSPVYCLLSLLTGLPFSFFCPFHPSLPPSISPSLIRFVFSNVPFIPHRPLCPSLTSVN